MAYSQADVGTGVENAAQEAANVEMIAAMMGGGLDLEAARRVLRKCNGDVQKAATAFLEGTADTMLNEPSPKRPGSLNVVPTEPSTPAQANPVIDLTSDDDELSRALNMSLESHSNENQLRPSNRAPDPAWAMVPSKEPIASGMSQDDQSLSRAIEASYNDFIHTDDDASPPLEHTIREGNRPVVIRTHSPSITYAALLLQALFFVPQVKSLLAKHSLALRDSQDRKDCPLLPLIELYAHMDLGALGMLLGDDLLCGFDARPWNGPSDYPGDLSADFLRRAAYLIDDYVRTSEPNLRLFNFKHGKVVISPAAPDGISRGSAETCIVMLDVNGSQLVPNNLLARLSANLSEYVDGESRHELIFEPSQVVVFHLRQGISFSTSSSEAFVYPKSMYMDQFLGENLKLTNEKRTQQQQIQERLGELASRTQILTKSNGSDGLQALRASIHYYQHIADAKANPERRLKLEVMLQKLQAILTNIEKEIEDINSETTRLKEQESALFDCPELKKHEYDLRAVFMHTGIPGRKQIYVYVHHDNAWWKMVDTEVTKVTEDVVLTDTTGLHLGAGPYMLFYSKALPPDQQPVVWAQEIEDDIKGHNTQFLQSTGAEIGEKAQVSTQQQAAVKSAKDDIEMKVITADSSKTHRSSTL